MYKDHVMFDECINIFRPRYMETSNATFEKNFKGYILLDFELKEAIISPYFTIDQTIEKPLSMYSSAFVAPVLLPDYVDLQVNGYLFTQALSAVISLSTSRPVKSVRTGSISHRELTDELLSEVAINFPVLVFGRLGGSDYEISQNTARDYRDNIKRTLDILFGVPHDVYVKLMQSIRLVHLAHINKKDDFSLAYYLLISAVEPAASAAIKKEDLLNENDLEIIFSKKEIVDKDVIRLFKTFSNNNRLIRRSFAEFIIRFCPPEKWNELKPINYNKYTLSIEKGEGWNSYNKRRGTMPGNVPLDTIEKILKDTYDHRSKYTHQGRNMPHKEPDSFNDFFDEILIIDDKEKLKEITVPTYRLMTYIVRESILSYYSSKIG